MQSLSAGDKWATVIRVLAHTGRMVNKVKGK